jgi:hypothetical protein
MYMRAAVPVAEVTAASELFDPKQPPSHSCRQVVVHTAEVRRVAGAIVDNHRLRRDAIDNGSRLIGTTNCRRRPYRIVIKIADYLKLLSRGEAGSSENDDDQQCQGPQEHAPCLDHGVLLEEPLSWQLPSYTQRSVHTPPNGVASERCLLSCRLSRPLVRSLLRVSPLH